MDGDLDVVLGARRGAGVVLRNNGDGTFRAIEPVRGRDATSATSPGPTSTATATPTPRSSTRKGALRIFSNERAGTVPAVGRARRDSTARLAAGDRRPRTATASWTCSALARRRGRPPARRTTDEGRDVGRGRGRRAPAAGRRRRAALRRRPRQQRRDRPGRVRRTSGGWIGLGDGAGRFRRMAAPSGLRVFAVADLNGDGRSTWRASSGEGRPARGHGTRDQGLPLAGHPAPRARRPSATAGSTRSASAARSRSGPACSSRSR